MWSCDRNWKPSLLSQKFSLWRWTDASAIKNHERRPAGTQIRQFLTVPDRAPSSYLSLVSSSQSPLVQAYWCACAAQTWHCLTHVLAILSPLIVHKFVVTFMVLHCPFLSPQRPMYKLWVTPVTSHSTYTPALGKETSPSSSKNRALTVRKVTNWSSEESRHFIRTQCWTPHGLVTMA